MKVATQRTLSGLRRSVFVIFAGVFGVITGACGLLGIGGILMGSKAEIGGIAIFVGFAFCLAFLFGLLTNKCLKAAQMNNSQATPPKYME